MKMKLTEAMKIQTVYQGIREYLLEVSYAALYTGNRYMKEGDYRSQLGGMCVLKTAYQY